VCGEVQVSQRKQVLVSGNRLAVAVDEAVSAPAGLGALAAVAAAPADGIAHVALPTVAHAQRAVDKGLQLDGGASADGPDLGQAQLAGEDHALDADLLQERHPLGGVAVHLRAGDERDGWQIALEQAHVLDDGGVHAYVVELVDQAHRLGKLGVV
jgi:hypothetical protein